MSHLRYIGPRVSPSCVGTLKCCYIILFPFSLVRGGQDCKKNFVWVSPFFGGGVGYTKSSTTCNTHNNYLNEYSSYQLVSLSINIISGVGELGSETVPPGTERCTSSHHHPDARRDLPTTTGQSCCSFFKAGWEGKSSQIGTLPKGSQATWSTKTIILYRMHIVFEMRPWHSLKSPGIRVVNTWNCSWTRCGWHCLPWSRIGLTTSFRLSLFSCARCIRDMFWF